MSKINLGMKHQQQKLYLSMKWYDSMTTPTVTDTKKDLISPLFVVLRMFFKNHISLVQSSVNLSYKVFRKASIVNHFCF